MDYKDLLTVQNNLVFSLVIAGLGCIFSLCSFINTCKIQLLPGRNYTVIVWGLGILKIFIQ